MGGIQVLFDQDTGAVFRVVEDQTVQPPSFMVLRGQGLTPVIEKAGRGRPQLAFGSIRFLKYAAPEFLFHNWSSRQDDVILVALAEFGPGGCTTAEITKKLNEEPAPLGAESKDIEKTLKRMTKEGSIKAHEFNKSKVCVLADPKLLVPTEFDWISTNSADLETPTAKKRKTKRAEIVPESPSAESASSGIGPGQSQSFAQTFVAEICGQLVEEGEEYLRWLRNPLLSSLEIRSHLTIDQEIRCNKSTLKHFEILAALPPTSIAASDKAIHSKALAQTALGLLCQDSAENLLGEPWFKGHLQSLMEIALGKVSADKELVAIARVLGALGEEPRVSQQLLAYVNNEKGMQKRVMQVGKTKPDELAIALSSLILNLAPGPTKLQLIERVLKDFRVEIDFDVLFESGNPEFVSRVLYIASAVVPKKMQAVRDSAAKRLNQLALNLSKLDQLLKIIEIVDAYGVTSDPIAVGKAFRKSLTASGNARYLAGEVSGQDEINALSVELKVQAARVSQLEIENSKLRAVNTDFQLELERHRTLLLKSRTQDQSMLDNEERNAQLPVIKAMAKGFSAAIEFLTEQPGALTRLTLIAEQVGLFPIGAHGQSIKFDKQAHEDPDGYLEDGSEGQIHTVGFTWTGGGQVVVVLKARVRKT